MKRLLDFLGLPLHWQPPYRPQDPLVSLPFTAQLYTHMHTHMRAYTYGNTHTCTQRCLQTRRHTDMQLHSYTCTHRHMQTYGHARGHTCVCLHTLMCTQTCTCNIEAWSPEAPPLLDLPNLSPPSASWVPVPQHLAIS